MKRPRSRKGAPGIIEVAARAGVSPATVSRFYNSPDIVRPPTRRRIEKAAGELGYIRDRIAGSLHNSFSGTIGLVVPTIDNTIFSELIEAFANRLREQDRTLLIAAHGYALDLEVAIIRSLLERRIDGVALIGLDHNIVAMDMLATRDVPVVSVWNYRGDSALPCIGADNFEAGYRVTKHLIERGHRKIGLVLPPRSNNDRAQDRAAGALAALAEHGIELDPHHNCESIYDIGKAKAVVTAMIGSDPPTAIACGNDVIAQGAIYACQARGVRVPDDISIIGIGDFRGSAHMEPALTTLRMPATRIGREAAQTLCAMIDEGAPREPVRRAMETTLMERQSVRSVG